MNKKSLLFIELCILVIINVNLVRGITATGGTTSEASGYKYHTYTANGTFNVTSGSGYVEILVIGGGGGAGRGTTNTSRNAGGGGAGGLILMNYSANTSTNVQVVIGIGGTGATATTARGGNGSSSLFGSLTAVGGGGGGSGSSTAGIRNGVNGSSGGGAGVYGTSTGVKGNGTQTLQAGDSGTYGYGNDGSASSLNTSGGGGGAGGVASGTGGGAGMDIWSTTYADGGDAHANNAAGGANTGQGGNASATNSANNGGNGGTGIVIVRYPAGITVNINTSQNNTVFATDHPTIYFNHTNSISSTANCTLYFGSTKSNTTNNVPKDTTTALTANWSVIDANYSVYINCTADQSNNENSSSILNIVIDTSAPTVGAISPANGNWTNDTTPDFNFSVNDSQSSRLNCYLSMDGTINATNASTMNNTITKFTPAAAISEGTHNWTINCSDNASNKNFSAERNISIDITGPVATLDRPANNDNLSGASSEVNASLTDAGINNISLVTFEYRVNGTDTWKFACSDDRGPDYACIWDFTGLEDGTDYQFRVWANDTLRNIGAYDTHTSINITLGGYVVINASANTRFVKADNISVNVSQTAQSGVTDVLAGDSSATGNYSALINLNFSQNIDVSALSFGTNRTTAKSFIHNSSGITGLVNKSLLIPRINNVGSIYICPGATSLAQVDSQCSGVFSISTGQTVSGMTVSEVSYDGEGYYLVTNITGTGGGEPDVSNLIQCVFIQNTTCPSGTARLIGVENDTHNGYNNSHAQNYSRNTYNYSICCNSTNASITISGACPGNETVIRLSNATNAHVQIGNYSGAINYTNASACLGSSFKSVSCNYPTGSCTSPYACILSMANSEGDNTTDAHVGNCSQYNQKVCCALVNHAPTKPVLIYPADNNASVLERRVNFTWTASTDSDGDAIDYSVNATCGAGCTCNPINIGGITGINYTATSPLCVDTTYNWTVTACDVFDECNTSTQFNFSIASIADLRFIINVTSFGSMAPNSNNNTLDRSPTQLVVENIGNVMLNLTINATNFFTSVGMDTRYYQFESTENESGSSACPQTAFVNMSNTTQKQLYCNLSYEANVDQSNIELNITVPQAEPVANLSSTIEVDYVKSE